MKLISPHGNRLINRELKGTERKQLALSAVKFDRLSLNSRQTSDLLMIATGAYSPIEGFLGEADYLAVISTMRLADGVVWPIPITLAVSAAEANTLQEGRDVALYQEDQLIGVLHLTEKYTYDKQREAQAVYKTSDSAHPGVQNLYAQGDWLLGGRISLINRPRDLSFLQYRHDPTEIRVQFEERGWRRVVAFQTRNPVHRAHEYIQKCALEMADGLLLHPLVGETKSDDVPAAVRIKSYEKILANYYPASRTILSLMPLQCVMRDHVKPFFMHSFGRTTAARTSLLDVIMQASVITTAHTMLNISSTNSIPTNSASPHFSLITLSTAGLAEQWLHQKLAHMPKPIM
jgi:sulfate adenylyltransferase